MILLNFNDRFPVTAAEESSTTRVLPGTGLALPATARSRLDRGEELPPAAAPRGAGATAGLPERAARPDGEPGAGSGTWRVPG